MSRILSCECGFYVSFGHGSLGPICFYTEGNKYEACDIPDFMDYLNEGQVNRDKL